MSPLPPSRQPGAASPCLHRTLLPTPRPTGLIREPPFLRSALEDSRFPPVEPHELPHLQVGITLLTDFEPAPGPLTWDIGVHGIRISFTHQGKRLGATYLPDVAREQGWSKTETMVSLMRKAGWSGRREEWTKVADMSVVRYQGRKCTAEYEVWRGWREWVEEGQVDL